MANETITGKIFTLKDPTGTYNRFPRTVMEAVYGLNTYLQNQFSALADIYMPIEGITESKPLQEFVYRKSPATIKAKSLMLDRIYGKTLAWNQLINKSIQMSCRNCTYNSTNGTITFNGVDGDTYFNTLVPGIGGHKYLFSFFVDGSSNDKTKLSGDGYNYTFGLVGGGILKVGQNNFLFAPASSLSEMLFDDGARPSGALTITISNISLIDLTLLYGSEIDGLTDAQILAKFEAEYPGYHDYSAGKLISNDAESIETVGLNQWDEEWEEGIYNCWGGGDGAKIPYSGYVRTKNFIPVIPGETYYVKSPHGLSICFYDGNESFLGGNYTISRGVNAYEFVAPSNAYYIAFYVDNSNYPTYNHDICINLSDPAKNGTYEPYRKSVMQLGLGNIKVKSHNIWDEEWERGYISMDSGQNTEYLPNFRTKNYIRVIPNQTYYIKSPYSPIVYFYDQDKRFISAMDLPLGGNETFQIIQGANYVRFAFGADGASYNYDICINVSSSFNGQYEPHGDITITGGLKGAGSVYDEVVSNKLVKRFTRIDMSSLSWHYGAGASGQLWYAALPKFKQGGRAVSDKYIQNTSQSANDCANGEFNITDSSTNIFLNLPSNTEPTGYLDYELATPIEYELVSPLVPTVKAGTTEARISPNADGISAPMVADMTYDAQANNDSASAQYALTAGRLLNSHKLWGQDFDGTQDVEGALSGVTSIGMSGAGTVTGVKSIDSLLYFDTTNSRIGIGKSSPAQKLDVEGIINAQALFVGGSVGIHVGATYSGSTSSSYDLIERTQENGCLYFQYNHAGPVSMCQGGGNVGIGTNAPEYKLTVIGTFNATGAAYLDSTLRIGGSSGITLTYVSANNGLNFNKGIYSDSYGVFAAAASSSDARLKDGIAPVQNAMDIIMALKPSEWTWNDKHSLSGQKGAGLVAQDVEKVLPFAVVNETEYLSLNYDVFHAYEIAGLQNHEKRIAELERENKELKERVKQLEIR